MLQQRRKLGELIDRLTGVGTAQSDEGRETRSTWTQCYLPIEDSFTREPEKKRFSRLCSFFRAIFYVEVRKVNTIGGKRKIHKISDKKTPTAPYHFHKNQPQCLINVFSFLLIASIKLVSWPETLCFKIYHSVIYSVVSKARRMATPALPQAAASAW